MTVIWVLAVIGGAAIVAGIIALIETARLWVEKVNDRLTTNERYRAKHEAEIGRFYGRIEKLEPKPAEISK